MALKTSIIHCLLDPEPHGFHAKSDGSGAAAVNLGFECPTDIARTDLAGKNDAAEANRQSLEDDEHAAQARFSDFAGAVQTLRFHLFEVQPDALDANKGQLDHKGEIAKISDAAAPGAAADMMAWLGKAAGTAPSYWTTFDGTDALGATVNAETASATYRLRAAQSWNAPVAHRLGLTHILLPEGMDGSLKYAVLPFFAAPADPLPAIAGVLNGELWDFDYDAGASLGQVIGRIEIFAPAELAFSPETISDFLNGEAYLKVDPEAEDIWRTTRWFEARAASLMSPVAALAELEASFETKDTPFQWSYQDDETAPLLLAPAPVWLAVASLTAALDNIVIGLMKPVSGNSSAGDILAPFLLSLSSRIEDTIADVFGLDAGACDPVTLTEALRRALMDNPLLSTTASVPPAPLDRAALAHHLRLAHRISVPDKDTPITTLLLDALLSHFATDVAVPAAFLKNELEGATPKKQQEDLQQLLRRALAEAEQRLQEEAGAEAAILRLLENTQRPDGTKLPAGFTGLYLDAIDRSGDAALAAAVEATFVEAFKAYKIELEGPFNGAEAVRRASAGEFVNALLLHAKRYPAVSIPEAPPSTPAHLIATAAAAGYHAERLLRPAGPADPNDPSRPVDCFWRLCDTLVRIPLPAVLEPVADRLRPVLDEAYAQAMEPMAVLTGKPDRFIPDQVPAPLPIQIAATVDSEELEEFSKYFNGIAVAIRRIDTDDRSDPWAHASLADLTWPLPSSSDPGKEPPAATVSAALHPFLPAASDGRGAMFITYEGLPLAATTFLNTAAHPIAETPEAFSAFYAATAPDLDASAFAMIPRLAYGRAFETFSFATTNAGSLPPALRGALPWMPDAAIKEPDPDLIATTHYQRRTALGQMALNEILPPGRPRRIGAPAKGVTALGEDYPRTVIAAFAGTPGVRDIFRDRDGRGMLTIPAMVESRVEWAASGAAFTERPSMLVVQLFDRAPLGPDDPGLATLTIDFAGADLMAITRIAFGVERGETGPGNSARFFYVDCGDGLRRRTQIAATQDISAGWIRLSLHSKAPVCFSFAVNEDIKPYETAAPLLLLSPKDTAWKSGFSDPVTVEIDTPRIGYLDFQRWFANADLRSEALGDAAAHLERALLTAYVLRDADEKLARALDRLPDPAFEGLRVELAVADQLTETAVSASARILPFSLKTAMAGILEALKLHGARRWTPDDLYLKLFRPIEQSFKFRISIEPGAFGISGKGPVVATVPEGCVARLSLDALVSDEHFWPLRAHPPVFHEGLRQHAARLIADENTQKTYLAYPSAAIRVETMIDAMHRIDTGKKEADKPAISLVRDMVAVRPAERARRYDIETRPEVPGSADRTHQWRLIGEIDVTSQRWRPSGRPIYNHIVPQRFADKAILLDAHLVTGSHAALPLSESTDEHADNPLSRFEQEAFFDRPDMDSQTVTQRLSPLPSRTVLQQHVWDAPSATYFRHRFTLRSRYAGALTRSADREVRAWITDRQALPTPAHGWTMRVAMLADLSRLILTRPQQRALIPLTAAPRDGDESARTPPVLAILQEPPFSRGGLADRIAADIKTGFGYGFASPDGLKEHPVEILDSRKEIGPDPRLSYRPMAEDTALAMTLCVEGPMGLTFDAVNAPAPAFPNSMLTLTPLCLAGAEQALEDHFLGVSMRRYIDADWTAAGPAADPLALDAEHCWWITRAAISEGDLLAYVAEGAEVPLMTLAEDDGCFIVRAMKATIDGVAGTGAPDVSVARWRKDFAENLSILHQAVAPGHYSTAVFVTPRESQGNVRLGRGNAPLLVCNIEWGPPRPKVEKDQPKPARPVKVTLKAECARARPTMASAPTFLAWTRIGRNFDRIHSPDLAGRPDGHDLPVRALVAKLDPADSTVTFDLNGVAGQAWLCSSSFLKPYPLHVQRHLALLTTRYLDEPGRPVEEYGRAALLVGRTSTVLSGPGRQTQVAPEEAEDCLRIVEFETPAAILCAAKTAIPQTYRKVYFDLVATGFSATGGPAAARLLFRLTGPAAHIATFQTLTIKLYHGQDGKNAHTIAIDLQKSPKGSFVTAIELFIERAEATGKLVYRPVLLFSNGEVLPTIAPEPPDDLGLGPADDLNPGFFVEIETESESELWADVSLLHAPRAKFGTGFDFDWLFSPAGQDDPASEVTPARLHAMAEAQARVVSVSPPVPIRPNHS